MLPVHNLQAVAKSVKKMDTELEESVRLLENALDSSKNVKTSNTMHQFPDVTVTYTPNTVRRILEKSKINNTMALVEGEDTIAGSIIQGSTPWKETVNDLFTEFADIMQNCSGGADILEAAEDLARSCSDALSVIKTFKRMVNLGDLEEEKWLENERNNWRLLFILYKDRIHSQNVDLNDSEPYTGSSEKTCIADLFQRDSLIRESQLVIDWLERNALERDDPILHYNDFTYGWENTLHQLLAPDSIAIGSTVDIITNIHPDAPISQNLSLHHLDNANEKKLCQRVFTEIRCGNLEAAQELCHNSGHSWRAAMLEGWKLFHNPNIENIDNMDSDEYHDIEGNINRDLWKVNAIKFCKNNLINLHERASIAVQCGYLDTILPVCNSWEDYLWAYMRTMVDIRVESQIRDTIIRNYTPLPDEYWDQKLSLDAIFAHLESSDNHMVSIQSKQIDHIIQKHIILDQIPALIYLIDEWSEDETASTHLLRYFAHLVLFFEAVGQASDRRTCEKILETYINRLSANNETQLVAFYISKVGKQKQIALYARHCENITTNEDRRAALRYAEDFSLNTMAITQRIVETIINKPSSGDLAEHLQRKLTEADEAKISALDWLLFYEDQRIEAMSQANSLIFKFMTLRKLEAAQLALTKIPLDSVDKIRAEGDISDETSKVVKTFLSYKAYLDAHEAFNEWFKQFTNKPTPPADLPENAQFTEKVAHKHRVSQFRAETERWKLTTSHSAKTTKTLLYNVLLFPQGWLVGAEDANYLRSICIPEVVLLLYSVLSESGQHAEAVQLADLLAAEKYGLYKVYSKEKLREVLEKISESSVALLNAKKDPFGNPTSA